jgi:hypothetical protein
MSTHRIEDSSGATFEVHVDESGQVTDVVGPWPERGGRFDLRGDLPNLTARPDVPEHIKTSAAERGMEVCFHDEIGCRTCFCDGKGHVHCVGEC